MTAPYCSLSGAAYGIALNDSRQLAAMTDAFQAAPYKALPRAPVLYIKPRTCFSFGGAPTVLPSDMPELQIAATIGLLFARDLTDAKPEAVRSAVGAACLALDVCEPCDSVYRPAIRQQCRDGFLPLGGFGDLPNAFGDIVTSVDGREAHRWALDRLVRSIETAAAEISGFMTLRAGDLLLVGIPGDAPQVRAGQVVTVTSASLPPLQTAIVPEMDR